MVRLRLYALCLAGDMAGLFCAFLAANYFVLGALWGEPGKPHGLVMFAMVAPLYALLAVQGGAYGINTIDHLRRGIVRALWALAQAALLMLLIVYLGKIAEQLSRLTFITGLLLGALALALVRIAVARLAVSLLGGCRISPPSSWMASPSPPDRTPASSARTPPISIPNGMMPTWPPGWPARWAWPNA